MSSSVEQIYYTKVSTAEQLDRKSCTLRCVDKARLRSHKVWPIKTLVVAAFLQQLLGKATNHGNPFHSQNRAVSHRRLEATIIPAESATVLDHNRSQHNDAIPLVLIHGWPGSILEFTELIPQLVNPGKGKQAFHVVAPSLPGFAFSSAPKHKGFGLKEMAKTFNQLMLELGYTKYVAQGGDWGSMLSKALGIFHPDHCKGIHDTKRFMDHESAYQQEQSTKPQTLGYALNDSPAGLLGWFLEKFHQWSDRREANGQVPYSMDFLITNTCLYWLTGNVTSSLRIYYESKHTGDRTDIVSKQYCKVPTAVAVFPKEIYKMPKNWGTSLYNIQQWTVYSKGGHFAAKEEPETLAQDMQKFFGNKATFGQIF
ncbi:hypothetical protein WJX79_000868 [Trebouxia sp. C0005]